ncbi:MAG: TetR/AcrR family transcriptional regulator [Clostridiales bacterium]|jgi:AcrR family transcriptional regulator|nr:TetR/AcrR family transcriptional regulator [Eubacteriales bacterium]MDH7566017.1 TetR/AcrR family transcriptional regulator [Clostridiales bacterium]
MKLTNIVDKEGGVATAKEDNIIEPGSGDSKRKSILNAAMAEFCNGYEKASTDAIVKAAGVSKGLLFHYFGTKKDLFLHAYDYAIQVVMAEFFDLINLDERDILERWRQIALLKMDLMKKHPMIFDFIAHASFPDSEDVKNSIMEQRNKLTNDVYPKLFYDIDRTLFREDIDVDAAIRVILYTIEGYAQDQADPGKSTADYYGEYDRYLSDLEGYIRLFRKSFYRQGESQWQSSK